ncbi:hypothetical protein D3C81_870840 [compost metagenome]
MIIVFKSDRGKSTLLHRIPIAREEGNVVLVSHLDYGTNRFNDHVVQRNVQRIHPANQRFGRLFDFRRIRHRGFDQFDTVGVQSFLSMVRHDDRIRFALVDDQSDRFHVFKIRGDEVHQLGNRLRVRIGSAGDVPARMIQIVDQFGIDRIRYRCEQNR